MKSSLWKFLNTLLFLLILPDSDKTKEYTYYFSKPSYYNLLLLFTENRLILNKINYLKT